MSWALLDAQPKVRESLRAMIATGHLPHALLFAGAADERRRQTAGELTKALFCETQSGDPCDVCRACRLVDKRMHPDYYVLTPSKETAVIKIEPVRELIARANLKPLEAPSKVFVIEQADAMTEDAQNSLLKTLEEPAGNTLIILIPQDPRALLPTIRSRAQSLYFVPEPGVGIEDPEIAVFIAHCLRKLVGSPDAATFVPAEYFKSERLWLGQAIDALVETLRRLMLDQASAGEIARGSLLSREARSAGALLSSNELIDAIESSAEARERIVSLYLNVRLVLANWWENLG